MSELSLADVGSIAHRATGVFPLKIIKLPPITPPGELFPRVGFIATNRSLPNEPVLAFYNDRGKAEQHIKEGMYALSGRREASCG